MRAILALVLLCGCADNQALCERATERVNDERVACGLDEVDVVGSCLGFERLNETDCTAYFACDAQRFTCTDGQLLESSETCPPCE
ncbi:MAG: hypothetical protein KC912_02510 [Proteobacteria bacterium]|nr:hypothetical protein [Pseudomonadota bacterium]